MSPKLKNQLKLIAPLIAAEFREFTEDATETGILVSEWEEYGYDYLDAINLDELLKVEVKKHLKR